MRLVSTLGLEVHCGPLWEVGRHYGNWKVLWEIGDLQLAGGPAAIGVY